MKVIRKLIFLILLIFGSMGGLRLHEKLTDGFGIRQIQGELLTSECALSVKEDLPLGAILNQPFRYKAKGCQFYAFESADGEYILKFFKMKHLRPHSFFQNLPLPASLRTKVEDKIARRRERIKALVASSRLVFEKMPEETALLYLHFNKEPLPVTQLTLIDKMGLRHRIPLAGYPFILQKRALTMQEALSQASSKQEVDAYLDQLRALVIDRCEKGIQDRDRAMAQNIGFLPHEHRACYIDVGQFYTDESLQTNERQAEELLVRRKGLEDWMRKRFPELIE